MLLGISITCEFFKRKKILHFLCCENLNPPLALLEANASQKCSDISERIIILVINSCQKHNVRFAYLMLVGCRVSLNKLSFVFFLALDLMIG